MVFKSVLIALVLVGLAQLAFRAAPLPRQRLEARPGPMAPGVHPFRNGLKIVRPLDELPADAFARLLDRAAATPRTRRVDVPEGPAAFVTRSRLWGFPDIAVIWVEDGALHLHSQAVFGRSDLGVNAARAARWFEALEAPGA